MQTVNWEGCRRKQSWPVLTLVMPGSTGGLCLKYFTVFAEITNIYKKITPNFLVKFFTKIFSPVHIYKNIHFLFETHLLILNFLNESLSVTDSTTLTSEQARKLFCNFLSKSFPALCDF